MPQQGRDSLSAQVHVGQSLQLRLPQVTPAGTPMRMVTFIALLELSKEGLLEVTQAEAFAPIYVRLAYTPT